MTIPAPFSEFEKAVPPEWIDYNGHMNLAWYLHAFDLATDAFYDAFGIGWQYVRDTGNSVFAMETHITYQAELYEGELLRVETQLLGVDAKRVHHFHRMLRASDGALAATCEWLGLHVSLAERRSCPIPDDLAARLADAMAAHGRLPDPPERGRVMGLSAKGGG